MKTQTEIDANVLGCEKKIQELLEIEKENFSYLSTAGKTSLENGRKTREYIKGWIDALKGVEIKNSSPEFKIGYDNGKKWLLEDV